MAGFISNPGCVRASAQIGSYSIEVDDRVIGRKPAHASVGAQGLLPAPAGNGVHRQGEGGLSANDKKGLAHEIPDTPLNGRGHTNLLAL